MRISAPYSRKKARIEIIPLIDIVFFLLATFVMVSMSMVKNQGVPVRLPSAATAERRELKAFTAITITESGDIYFNKDKVTLEEVSARLAAIQKSQDEPTVIVNGDERAHFGNAIRVLDEARKLGIQKVSIQTQNEDSKGVAP